MCSAPPFFAIPRHIAASIFASSFLITMLITMFVYALAVKTAAAAPLNQPPLDKRWIGAPIGLGFGTGIGLGRGFGGGFGEASEFGTSQFGASEFGGLGVTPLGGFRAVPFIKKRGFIPTFFSSEFLNSEQSATANQAAIEAEAFNANEASDFTASEFNLVHPGFLKSKRGFIPTFASSTFLNSGQSATANQAAIEAEAFNANEASVFDASEFSLAHPPSPLLTGLII